MKPTFVRTRRAVSSTPVRQGVPRANCSTGPASASSIHECRLPFSRSRQSQPSDWQWPMAVADQRRRAAGPVAEQPHASRFGQPGGHGVEQALLHAKADGALGVLDPPGQQQGALAPAQGQHEDRVPLGRAALVQDQVHPPLWPRVSGPASLAPRLWPRVGLRQRQHLACERQHHGVAPDPRGRQHPHDPLASHVDALRQARQGGRQRQQVGAALAQHGRDQKRQVLPPRLALPGQAAMQHHADTPGRMLDPTHSIARPIWKQAFITPGAGPSTSRGRN